MELSPDGENGSVVAVSAADGGYRAELVFYQRPAGLAAVVGGLYDGDAESPGVFLDPMPCAGVLDELAERAWVHRLEAVDVAAAAQQFLAAVRARIVHAASHPALEQALTYAAQRPVAAAFGFERRKVLADMSPLNASAFALWGLRRHEKASSPSVMVL